ncbi:MAG: carbamate kinase [Hyphomonas sp. BRH_c22]|uniref:carbamate kinase n=1 Tax=Hyphomonas sp. BRH_c22 TaxID=1629710 RepID=UPI0005F1065B|nr:carbamate kinase [Hyphomonas sp. BRH_c22]KJS36001.1 MAG: carbamate kinase [Hyphomonas sp. BRH_c22]
MRILVALGGNALLKRGEALTVENQRANVKIAASALAPLARNHELIVTHGNGPQVGLLALQGAAYKPDEAFPLDVLGAETEGMIGYVIERELRNCLQGDKEIATLLTMIEVDALDPAFDAPSKFVGPVYARADAERLAAEKKWQIKADGQDWRRVVASPKPQKILELNPIKWMLERGAIVICAGGGGIPTIRGEDGRLKGVEAVIDKDFASALLARELEVDLFIMATDVDAVYVDWGQPSQRRIIEAGPDDLDTYEFPAGSMGPKVRAACAFVRHSGAKAAIGALKDIEAIVAGAAGTLIINSVRGLREESV